MRVGEAGSYGLSPVMVGRDAELAQLRQALAEAERGGDSPSVVLLQGEAGVGKTRLLRELTRCARQEGTLVLAGHATEGTLPRPFDLVRDAFADVVATWEGIPEELAGREHALRHVLSPLVADHDPDPGHDHAADELIQAAVELVRHASASQTLLILEDLHWADAESLAVLERLATLPPLPLLVIATVRPEDFSRRHPLAHTLAALERQRAVTHLVLGRLDAGSLTRMLEAVFGTAIPTDATAALHERTQGNPFFVEELIASCGCSDPGELASAALPWNASEAVLRRLEDLPDGARTVAHAAAVLGLRVRFDLLAAVVGLDEATLIEALRALVDRGLLAEDDRDVFRFRHALTREAIAGQLLGRQQQRIHESALAALEAQGSPSLPDLVRHAGGAGDNARLVRYALEGAEAALREGSGAQALALAEAGLAAVSSATAADELQLRALAGRAAFHSGAGDVAQHLEEWRLLAVEEKEPLHESEALRLQALVRWEERDRQGYWQLVHRAHETAAPAGESAELAWCLAFLSQAHMLEGDPATSLDWAEQALALAGRLDVPGVRAYVLVNKGALLGLELGQPEEGLEVLREARQAALGRHDAFTATRATHNALTILNHLAGDQSERIRSLLAEGARIQERYGGRFGSHDFAEFRAELASRQGDIAAAIAHLEPWRSIPSRLEGPYFAAFLAALLAEADELGEAVPLLDRAEQLASEMDDWGNRGFVLAMGLLVRSRQGPAAARQVVPTILEVLAGSVGRGLEARLLPDLVADAAASAEPGGLRVEDLEAIEAALAAGGRVAAGRRAHLRGVLAERRGDHSTAVEAYREALAADEPRMAWHTAALQLGLARCLAAKGDKEAATEQAAATLLTLERWPGWRRADAETLHRRLTGSGQGTEVLTARELEVLELVAEGLSNREIAETLYIAQKTAAVHVSNILAKTGTASRTEAATWALRSGILERDPTS